MPNKYTYNPPFTEDQLFDAYVNKGMSQCEVATAFGTTQRVVWRAMRKMAIPARKAMKRDQWGEKNSFWKGGRILVGHRTPNGYRFLPKDRKKGYWMVKANGHPHANRYGYVFEHIKVALEHAGRDHLDPGECVHHINFDRHDNSPLNLLICTHDKHREYHGLLETVVRDLLLKGVVRFDENLGYVHNCPGR